MHRVPWCVVYEDSVAGAYPIGPHFVDVFPLPELTLSPTFRVQFISGTFPTGRLVTISLTFGFSRAEAQAVPVFGGTPRILFDSINAVNQSSMRTLDVDPASLFGVVGSPIVFVPPIVGLWIEPENAPVRKTFYKVSVTGMGL